MDGVFVEILSLKLQAVVNEMAATVFRTGHTVFVKETGDFGTALIHPGGEVVAAPYDIGTSLMVGEPMGNVLRHFEDFERGDVIITNDPYATNGMVTHLADIYLIKPIFHERELVCFAGAFIHSSDVGGKVPGSISPECYDIFQEGIRIPPCRLFRRGELDQQILAIVLANSRIPDQNWGDLRALLASFHAAERRVGQLIERYGLATVRKGMSDVLDYAEARTRRLIRAMPPGEYVAWDYLEGQQFCGYPLRIRLRLHIQDDEVVMDFTGTDSQVDAAFNLPSGSADGHWMLVSSLIRYFCTVDPGIPYNSGLVRPLKVRAPEGTLLNPVPPAPVGVRAATMIRVGDTVLAALGSALPDRIPVAGAGQACIVLLSTLDFRRGSRRVAVLQPLCGGSGARPFKDGIDGMDFAVGFLRNIPTEVLEEEVPVLVLRYGYRPDSGGAGRYRGGCGIELTFQTLSPRTILTARGLERNIFRPWGREGGKPGKPGEVWVRREAEERRIAKIDEIFLEPGDVVSFLTQGGGGYADPLTRPVAEVLRDVELGFVSTTTAAAAYGVIIDDGNVNGTLTQARRAELQRAKIPKEFDFGPEREAYEAEWSDRAQLELEQGLREYPAVVRQYVKRAVVTSFDNRRRSGKAAPSVVEAIAEAVRVLGVEVAAL